MKPGKVNGPSKVCAAGIFASGEFRISGMAALGQRVMDGKGMPDKWQISVLVPLFKEKRCQKIS